MRPWFRLPPNVSSKVEHEPVHRQEHGGGYAEDPETVHVPAKSKKSVAYPASVQKDERGHH